MARTTRPTLNVVLRDDRDSTYYFVIRWKGKAYWHSTGVRGTTKYGWKKTKNIVEEFDRIETLLVDFQGDDGMITRIWGKTLPDGKKSTLVSLLDEMAKVRRMSDHTVKNYQRAIELYTEKFGNRCATTDEVQGWLKELRAQFLNSTIWSYSISLKSLFNYGIRSGIYQSNPFHFDLGKQGYKPKRQPKARNSAEVWGLWLAWEEEKNIWAGIWLAGFTFCGLALTDMLRVNWGDLPVRYFDGKRYFCFTIERKKTNQTAQVVVEATDRAEKLRWLMNDVCGWGMTCEALTEKLNRQLGYLKGFKPKLTYYQARHTYATQLVRTKAPLNTIASLLGRNVRQIETYIQTVQTYEVLASEVSKLSDLD